MVGPGFVGEWQGTLRGTQQQRRRPGEGTNPSISCSGAEEPWAKGSRGYRGAMSASLEQAWLQSEADEDAKWGD